ncbi:MAG: DUF2283 domain-containing protein [Caldilineaceae bacterium]
MRAPVDRNNFMAASIFPDSVQAHFPREIDPSKVRVIYSPPADSLTIYFTGQPMPSVWEDVDEYVLIGFSMADDTVVTGLMIEHFSRWLVDFGHTKK